MGDARNDKAFKYRQEISQVGTPRTLFVNSFPPQMRLYYVTGGHGSEPSNARRAICGVIRRSLSAACMATCFDSVLVSSPVSLGDP